MAKIFNRRTWFSMTDLTEPQALWLGSSYFLLSNFAFLPLFVFHFFSVLRICVC
jgi:hypothetical protein